MAAMSRLISDSVSLYVLCACNILKVLIKFARNAAFWGSLINKKPVSNRFYRYSTDGLVMLSANWQALHGGGHPYLTVT